ncbi:MAG: hypothetical protein AAFU70_12940, partial [Planctomycetota bacterium]
MVSGVKRGRRPWWLALAMVLCLSLGLTVSQPAEAQQDNVDAARAAEASARAAFRKKNYAEAAEGFAAAFKLDPKGNTKFNEAQAWRKAGQDGPAADAFEEAVTFGGLGDKLGGRANEALTELQAKLGRVVVKEPVGAQVTVAHAELRVIPARIHLEPGDYDVVVRFENGKTDTQTVKVVAGKVIDLAFEPPIEPDPEPKPSPKPVEGGGGSNTGLLVAGWTCTGLGAGALIAMGALGGLTLSKVSQYDDTGNTDPDL